MSMYRVDNLTMVISEIISFSYFGSSLYKGGSYGRKKQVLAERRNSVHCLGRIIFCRFETEEEIKTVILGTFYGSEGEIKVGLFVCEGRLPSLKYFV